MTIEMNPRAPRLAPPHTSPARYFDIVTQPSAKEEPMSHTRPEPVVNACLLQIGTEVVPVYGDDKSGWSFEQGLQTSRVRIYRTVDELFFALVNMNLSTEGCA